ncbi:Ribonuclease H-like domain containing protein [Trema orientale]|uniref:Ribonuclease H-like domain containing protein n=1 Tax=Trema orientale TaxID=63057 RepID=A0A2P5FY56_TREOI|nr:Ribonuclease H-like domain containing protein [Trema orientale]
MDLFFQLEIKEAHRICGRASYGVKKWLIEVFDGELGWALWCGFLKTLGSLAQRLLDLFLHALVKLIVFEICSLCRTRDVLLGIFWSLDKAGFEHFVVILWSIWFERNRVLYGQNCRDPSLVLESATQTFFDYQRVGRVDEYMHTTPSPRRWKLPSVGQVKMNTDAAMRPGEGYVGLGGVFRDNLGSVLACFAARYKRCLSVENNELLAIQEGMLFAARYSLIVNEVECDALRVVQCLNRMDPLAENALLVQDVQILLVNAGCGTCHYIPSREFGGPFTS